MSGTLLWLRKLQLTISLSGISEKKEIGGHYIQVSRVMLELIRHPEIIPLKGILSVGMIKSWGILKEDAKAQASEGQFLTSIGLHLKPQSATG